MTFNIPNPKKEKVAQADIFKIPEVDDDREKVQESFTEEQNLNKETI